MSAPGTQDFDRTEAVAELRAAQFEIAEAADAILFAAETCLSRLAAYRRGETAAIGEVERALCAILGACAFQDISGQRLSKVEDLLCGVLRDTGDPLARGPALGPDRLDQSAADDLFGAPQGRSEG